MYSYTITNMNKTNTLQHTQVEGNEMWRKRLREEGQVEAAYTGYMYMYIHCCPLTSAQHGCTIRRWASIHHDIIEVYTTLHILLHCTHFVINWLTFSNSTSQFFSTFSWWGRGRGGIGLRVKINICACGARLEVYSPPNSELEPIPSQLAAFVAVYSSHTSSLSSLPRTLKGKLIKKPCFVLLG